MWFKCDIPYCNSFLFINCPWLTLAPNLHHHHHQMVQKGGEPAEPGKNSAPSAPDPAFGTQEMVEHFAFILDTSAAAWAFWCFNWQFTGSLLAVYWQLTPKSTGSKFEAKCVFFVLPWWILQVNLMDWFQGYRIANHSIEARSGSSQIFCLLVVGSNPWKSFIRGSSPEKGEL